MVNCVLPNAVKTFSIMYVKCKSGGCNEVMKLCLDPNTETNDRYRNLLPSSSMCLKFKVNVKNQISIGRRQEIYMFQLIYTST